MGRIMRLHAQVPALDFWSYMAKYGQAILEKAEVEGLSGTTASALSAELERTDPANFQRFSQQTFSRWTKDQDGSVIGASSPKMLKALARLLKWTSEELELRVGVNPGRIPGIDSAYAPHTPASQYVEVPLTRRVDVYPAGTGPAWDLEEALEPLYLPADLYSGKELIGLRAMSASMEPYLPEGAIAVIVHDDGLVKPGDFCGVRMSDDGVVVKRFVQELDGGVLLLESLNPEPGEDRLFTAPLGSRIIGKVIRRVLEN